MKGIDFFCGAGGTTCGLLAAGIEMQCGIDIDLSAKKTYEQNRLHNGDKCTFIHKSITDLVEEDLAKYLSGRGDTPLLFSACPPCQPFTNIKTDKAAQGDSSRLALRFLEQIQKHKPEYVLMENVPGIRHEKFGTIFNDLIKGLKELAYNLDFNVLNARDFGVPQKRRRMIILASRLGPIRLPIPMYGPNRDHPYIAANVAFRFPVLVAGSCHINIPNHQSACLNGINLKRIQSIRENGGSRCSWNEELQLDCYRNHTGHTDVYGRISLEKPAPTLTTRFNSLSNGRFGHPTEDRAISLREGAALQTFPDEYIFHAKQITTIARHIGNAVPVLLATVLGGVILAHYEEHIRLQQVQ